MYEPCVGSFDKECVGDCSAAGKLSEQDNSNNDNQNVCTETKVTCHESRPVSPTFLLALGLKHVGLEAPSFEYLPTSRFNDGKESSSDDELLVVAKKKLNHNLKTKSHSRKKNSSVAKGKQPRNRPKDRVRRKTSRASVDKSYLKSTQLTRKTPRKPIPAVRKQSKCHESSKSCTAPPVYLEMLNDGRSSLQSDSESGDVELWNEIIALDFITCKYTSLLKDNLFPDNQITVLQEIFHILTRELRNRNSDYYMTKHECCKCNFSVSHRCVMNTLMTNNRCEGPRITIEPETITMCQCNFTILHSHEAKKSFKPKTEMLTPPNGRPIPENNRSIMLSCPRCNIGINVKDWKNDVCSEFFNWVSLDGPKRKKFFKYIGEHLAPEFKGVLHLKEFYSCEQQCCTIFHRCAEDAIADTIFPHI